MAWGKAIIVVMSFTTKKIARGKAIITLTIMFFFFFSFWYYLLGADWTFLLLFVDQMYMSSLTYLYIHGSGRKT